MNANKKRVFYVRPSESSVYGVLQGRMSRMQRPTEAWRLLSRQVSFAKEKNAEDSEEGGFAEGKKQKEQQQSKRTKKEH